MLTTGWIFTAAALYLGGLFLLAYLTDRRAARGPLGFLSSPVVYTLSLAVYCTSWTFYGAVGSAARNGLEYLTIYLGPTLVLMGWWFLMRKLVVISNAQRITSIADFISARYGKSALLSALVTVIALIGITPYISLQLRAVASSFDAFAVSDAWTPAPIGSTGLVSDTGFWVAVCMAAFVVLFGTRNLGADERHPGVVVAIAVESTVKLFSLGAIAFFVTFILHDGIRDLYSATQWHTGVQRLQGFEDGFETRWIALTFLSAAAMICLPRQFHVAVVEGADDRKLATASWLFPLYLGLVSLFVIPIAMSGMTTLPESTNPDLYVLSVPLAHEQDGLALIAFIGGLSAATSMVIVASIALSIMMSNHLIMPILLRLPLITGGAEGDLTRTLLLARRFSIVVILGLGFAYYRLTGSASPLASIGLISFVGVAQFLPALIGGLFWSNATKSGAAIGLFAGFFVWAYTLLGPTLAGAGWAFESLVAEGPWGFETLKPNALFGLAGWDPLVHGLFWSLTVNILLYIGISLSTRQSPLEQIQAALFINPEEPGRHGLEGALRGSATQDDLYHLTKRVMGASRAERIFRDYASDAQETIGPSDATFINYVERHLASHVGAASARSLVSGVVEGETVSLDSVIALLDEKQAVVQYSHELERKSLELEETAAALQEANNQLTKLDRMKDDFLSQVSHELRTPMTAIRSFSEILVDSDTQANQDSKSEHDSGRFLKIIHQESIRLTNLLDEILELGRLEQGDVEFSMTQADAAAVARRSIATMQGLALVEKVTIIDLVGASPLPVIADEDRLEQVFVNLLSNAIKFNNSPTPSVWVETVNPAKEANHDNSDLGNMGQDMIEIHIRDNGPGIPEKDRETVFSKFSRGWADGQKHRSGSGLGLPICKQMMQRLGGSLTLCETEGPGCTFAIKLPLHKTEKRVAAE